MCIVSGEVWEESDVDCVGVCVEDGDVGWVRDDNQVCDVDLIDIQGEASMLIVVSWVVEIIMN